MTRPTLPLWWRHCSPAFWPGSTCWGPGWGGRGAARSYVTMKRPTVKSQTTARLANRVSARESNRIGYQPVEARRGRDLSSDVTSQPWAGDGKWQRLRKRRRNFFSYCRLSAFHGILTAHSVFSVSTSLWEGEKKKKNTKKNRRLLVRRIIRNGAVSSLEVCEQGSARSLLDFGANTSTTNQKKKGQS